VHVLAQAAQAHYERNAYINLFLFACIMTSAKFKSLSEKCSKYALIAINAEIFHNNKWFTLFRCCIDCYLMAFKARISVLDYLHQTLQKRKVTHCSCILKTLVHLRVFYTTEARSQLKGTSVKCKERPLSGCEKWPGIV